MADLLALLVLILFTAVLQPLWTFICTYRFSVQSTLCSLLSLSELPFSSLYSGSFSFVCKHAETFLVLKLGKAPSASRALYSFCRGCHVLLRPSVNLSEGIFCSYFLYCSIPKSLTIFCLYFFMYVWTKISQGQSGTPMIYLPLLSWGPVPFHSWQWAL